MRKSLTTPTKISALMSGAFAGLLRDDHGNTWRLDAFPAPLCSGLIHFRARCTGRAVFGRFRPESKRVRIDAVASYGAFSGAPDDADLAARICTHFAAISEQSRALEALLKLGVHALFVGVACPLS